MAIAQTTTDTPEHIHSRDRSDLTTSSTDIPATPTSCVELLKEVAEGAVAGLLDDDDTSFNTPPSHPAMFLPSWVGQNNQGFNRYSTMPPAYTDELPNAQTSVMLRNIPNKYTRSGLLSALGEHGFEASKHCNNLYLPMDAGSGCNLGYAFLNFHSHEEACEFMKIFDGCRLPSAGSRKVCSVVWANRQGIFQHSNPPQRLDDSPISTASSPPVVATDRVEVFTTNCCKVFVGGLSATTTEADLVSYFSQFGQVKECCIVTNRQTGTSRGFGFCEFSSSEGVQRVHVAQLRKPHAVSGRVVSVRLYNFQHNNLPIYAAPAQSEFYAPPPWQPGYF